jgi:predicted ester cyclase
MGELRRIIEKHYENVATNMLDEEDAIFSRDVVTVEPGTGKIEGLAAFKAYEEAFHRAFPDGHMVMKSAVESGNTIATQGSFVGTHTGPLIGPAGEISPTYRKLDLPFGDFFQIENGNIVSHSIYYDQVAFLMQLGLMPSPASA